MMSVTDSNARYSGLQKARNAERYLFRRESFEEYPDLWAGSAQLDAAEKITMANPQQDRYLWGSVGLHEWISYNGDTLEGLLYKPALFNPDSTYPMIVYFYERSSQGLYSHWGHSPSRSVVSPSYLCSNGYMVFMPDIVYRDGYPGQSAYDAIISGTRSLFGLPYLDTNRIGMQGQSWGGYQVAWLVTRTDLFACAMAGAPVSNMTSAYGGIRWGAGLSRAFQYERSQSRIGYSLQDSLELYIENSPVFFVKDINTPLLLMHNDNDGAVPWYQGIEMFTSMRRYQKPVWMLVYNGDEHNLTKWPNRIDLSTRMYQFFDFYLKEAPEPDWMKFGVPAVDKGKRMGY
jgi:dipeptidyl aminopeptidase/acylaminoacyl peptidase